MPDSLPGSAMPRPAWESDPMPRDHDRPIVSIIMADDGDAGFTEAAVRSALRQTMRDLEVIVAIAGSVGVEDSHSLTPLAHADPRLVLLPIPAAKAAGRRNRCLDLARGEWVTTLGCDDLMHEARLERLLAAVERDGADIVCDNSLIFDESNRDKPRLAVTGAFARAPARVDIASFVRALAPIQGSQGAISIRPLIRMDLLRLNGFRYDPAFDDVADFDLALGLLVRGACFWWYPGATCFRRQTSHRGPRTSARSLDAALAAVYEKHAAALRGEGSALPRRGVVLLRRMRNAIAVRRRRLVSLFQRIIIRPPAVDTGARHVCIISRQRLIGRTNGSSSYLIGLASSIAERGFRVHLVCPSPSLFGRTPAFVLRPEMSIFASIAIRGAFRVGNVVIATDPVVALRAACAVLGKLLAAAGMPFERLTRPAPYAIRQNWRDEDFLFLARHARAHADVIVADYAFLTDGIPYVLRPEAPTAVVMHDLLSSRAAQYGPLGAAEASLDLATELRLLDQADAVVAIQPDEAATVRRHLPRRQVILAPIAVEPVSGSRPGEGTDLLFVASKTTANIDGLAWFIDQVWPAVRSAIPDAALLVAGTVGEMFASVPPGIRLLGLVPDLGPLYAKAAVVISPLRGGSGLKIKLVEAMAQGKAIVATTTTLQGVDAVVRPAVMVADDPTGFAAAIVCLLGDAGLRRQYADAALGVARTRFSAEACHADFLAFLDSPKSPVDPAFAPAIAR